QSLRCTECDLVFAVNRDMENAVPMSSIPVPAKAEALLVSDRGPLVRSLRESLERAGYDMIWAHSGRLGLTHARDDSPDLVLVDFELEDMPVFDFCQALRDDPEFTRTTPLMVVSTE